MEEPWFGGSDWLNPIGYNHAGCHLYNWLHPQLTWYSSGNRWNKNQDIIIETYLNVPKSKLLKVVVSVFGHCQFLCVFDNLLH